MKLGLAFFFAAIGLFAQANTATITGQVLDSSGAGVADATITARNVQTGLERTVKTDDSANYTVSALPIGTYEVTSERQGFQKLIKTDIVLQVDQRARVDFNLQLGTTSNTVEVTADVPLTQTDSSSVGSVIDNRKVVELPLNGRQFYNLALLVPGVAPPAQGSILSFRGGFNVAGASELNNNFTLNGLDNNNQLLSAPAFRPSVDAIQEFKILTGVFPAEYGRNSGSQVIVTTKAGTNSFHGTAFEFLRNQKLDAVNYFTPSGFKPGFKQNQFGGTLGGPIIRNKTFFFASYEGTRSNQQITSFNERADYRDDQRRLLGTAEIGSHLRSRNQNWSGRSWDTISRQCHSAEPDQPGGPVSGKTLPGSDGADREWNFAYQQLHVQPAASRQLESRLSSDRSFFLREGHTERQLQRFRTMTP